MHLIERTIDLIAPHYCLGCNRTGTILCSSCSDRSLVKVTSRCYRCGSSTLQSRTCLTCRSSSQLFQVRAATVYDGLAKDVVGKLKFGRGQAAAPLAAAQIAATLPDSVDWLVTHVPTANVRVRRRGYDQARLIANCLSQLIDCPHATLLARLGSSRQLGQTRQARRRQMGQAFRLVHRDEIKDRHILLIDDVLTTGSTLEAAAITLKDAGAKRVSAAVFAVA